MYLASEWAADLTSTNRIGRRTALQIASGVVRIVFDGDTLQDSFRSSINPPGINIFTHCEARRNRMSRRDNRGRLALD